MRESESDKRNDSVLTDEKEDSIASRMKRRRNQQPDDDDDENNSYFVHILVSERERVMEVMRGWTSLLYIHTIYYIHILTI